MRRLAIISDIHGNIPALEAVFQEISARGIDRVFCLGDLAGKGPNSDLAVDMIKGRCEAVVQGNWDYGIANPKPDEPAWLHLDWYRSQPRIQTTCHSRLLSFPRRRESTPYWLTEYGFPLPRE